MNFVHVMCDLFLVWCEARTLTGLCVELGRALNADVVGLVLAHVRCISLEEALCRTQVRAVVCGYGGLCDPVFPTPDPEQLRYYLSQALVPERQIVIESRSA
jgi:hypothetical protein